MAGGYIVSDKEMRRTHLSSLAVSCTEIDSEASDKNLNADSHTASETHSDFRQAVNLQNPDFQSGLSFRSAW